MLIQADAKQLEWRTLVDLAADRVGIRELQDTENDLHNINQVYFKLPSRLIAKKYLFRTIYRGSGYAFSKDREFNHVSTDPAYWDDLNSRFFQKYWEINLCHERWASEVVKGKPIKVFTGHGWSFVMQDKVPWTTLTNYPVQGTGADIMAVARVSLKKRLDKLGIRGLISTVHDSIVVDHEDVDTVAATLTSVFDDIPHNVERLFGYKMNVAYPCEIKVGPNLTEMKPCKSTSK